MAKYIGKAISISTFKIKQCKLAPTMTVLCTHNFACTNVRRKLFYMHENQCLQILNLLSLDNYIHHMPYHRNSIAYDHDFWYTCVEWWYLQKVFTISGKFQFRGKRAKNSPKWKITITSVTHHISGTVYHMIIIFGALV